ncbi:hypothetical protein QKW35_20570 [Pontibacterium granulatum]|uniref:phage tail tube protein n=1 Tax=Pontibacterium granulatum TaxID=2036029 RepID=UPI00249B5FA7|nr:hypothetical protein [Pontibacterium granulatum]MDI3326778.1 hypothetical protein [Pontibacterium granulatum]
MSGLLLAGDVYIDRLTDTGNPTGLVGPINVTQLSLNTPSETKDRTSRKKESYGQVLDSVVLAQPTEINIAIDDQPSDILALAMLGDLDTINQGSGSVTDTAITLPANNRWLKLPHGNLAASVSAKLAADDSAVSTAAFEVNYALGLIRSVAGGALDTGSETAIKLSYSHNAVTGNRIKGAVRSTIRVRLFMDGKNLATGTPVKLQVPEAVVAPTEAVDLFASEYVSTTLAGKVKLLDGETAPFYLDQES